MDGPLSSKKAIVNRNGKEFGSRPHSQLLKTAGVAQSEFQKNFLGAFATVSSNRHRDPGANNGNLDFALGGQHQDYLDQVRHKINNKIKQDIQVSENQKFYQLKSKNMSIMLDHSIFPSSTDKRAKKAMSNRRAALM